MPGTYLVADVLPCILTSSVAFITAINSQLYFTAYGGETHGVELWTSDGTMGGTYIIKDIRPGANSGMSTATDPEFTLLNNEIFFVAEDGTTGDELWKTNGTSAGTMLVANIANGNNYSLPEQLVVMKGVLYFRAQTPAKGYELYRSDGTTAGTQMVKEINVGPYGIFDSNASGEIILVADYSIIFPGRRWHTWQGTLAEQWYSSRHLPRHRPESRKPGFYLMHALYFLKTVLYILVANLILIHLTCGKVMEQRQALQ